jgi:hypothetical protein
MAQRRARQGEAEDGGRGDVEKRKASGLIHEIAAQAFNASALASPAQTRWAAHHVLKGSS